MRIDIYKYRKYGVLALILMKFLQFLVLHEVIFYSYINVPIIYWALDNNKWITNMGILTVYSRNRLILNISLQQKMVRKNR